MEVTRLFSILNKPCRLRSVLLLGTFLKIVALWPVLGVSPLDFDGYFRDAKALVEFGSLGSPPGYSNMPGYPAFLAVFLKFLPESWLLLTNVLLFLAASYGFLKLLGELGIAFKIWNGILTLFLWFANPFLHYLHTKLLSENAFLPAFIFFTLFFIKYLKGATAKNLFYAVLFLALATYIRPVTLYLPLFMAVPIVVFKKTLWQYALAALLFFVILLPWGMRNKFLFGEFTLTTSQVAESFWGCNNEYLLYEDPDLRGNWLGLGDTLGKTKNARLKTQLEEWFRLHESKRHDEAENYAKERVLEFWREHADEMPGFVLSKLKWFWHYSGRHPANRTWYFDALGVIWYLVWLPLTFIWIWKKPRAEFTVVFLICAVYFSALTALTFGSVRLRMPIEFFLIATFIAAWPEVWRRVRA